MTSQEFGTFIKQPTGELYRLLLSRFAWGEQTEEWWDETVQLFTECADRYNGNVVGPYVSKIAVTYLEILSWAATEGRAYREGECSVKQMKQGEALEAISNPGKGMRLKSATLTDGRRETVINILDGRK